jgi:2-keto-3-deoxy-galactonokinase
MSFYHFDRAFAEIESGNRDFLARQLEKHKSESVDSTNDLFFVRASCSVGEENKNG